MDDNDDDVAREMSRAGQGLELNRTHRGAAVLTCVTT